MGLVEAGGRTQVLGWRGFGRREYRRRHDTQVPECEGIQHHDYQMLLVLQHDEDVPVGCLESPYFGGGLKGPGKLCALLHTPQILAVYFA